MLHLFYLNGVEPSLSAPFRFHLCPVHLMFRLKHPRRRNVLLRFSQKNRPPQPNTAGRAISGFPPETDPNSVWGLSQAFFDIAGEIFIAAQGRHIDVHVLAVLFHDRKIEKNLIQRIQ